MAPYPLEPGRAEMLTMIERAAGMVADFVDGLPDAPSVGMQDDDAVVSRLLAPPGQDPGDFEVLLGELQAAAGLGVETAGPSYLAYIPGGGVFSSALGEFVARVHNRYTGVSGLGPGSVAMEHGVMQWLCRVFELPTGAVGTVTTGGSAATLSALVAARERMLGEVFGDGTIYVTEHTHRSLAKAARVVGFPSAGLRIVPTTAELRMDPAAAARMIAEDRSAGLRPAMLVGTAGTTDTGTVDDLDALATLARSEGLWFHVDGAYGGFFRLTDRGRRRLRGIEHADSIVLDPHKGLFLPFGTGVLLVRDHTTLRAAFAGDAHYLQDLDTDETLPDYDDLTPELTRDARGPRLWLPLHLHGVAAFTDTLDEKLDLAAEVHEALSTDSRVDVVGVPDLTVVTFRLRDRDEAAQRRWLERINDARRVFLSSTRIDGEYTLRLCVLSHRTHADRVREALDIIRAAIPSR